MLSFVHSVAFGNIENRDDFLQKVCGGHLSLKLHLLLKPVHITLQSLIGPLQDLQFLFAGSCCLQQIRQQIKGAKLPCVDSTSS